MEANMESYKLDQLLSAAIAAQEINGEYIGSKAYSQKPKNKVLMMEMIQKSDPKIDENLDRARDVIQYCQTKMIELLSGELTQYWQGILKVINKEEIGPKDYNDLGLIASVPSAYERSVMRDRAMNAREQAMQTSRHFGEPGEKYDGKVRIISKIYSVKYGRTWFTAVDHEGNLVNFPHGTDLELDQEYKIKARIRKHGEDQTTLLHYVTIVVDSAANDVNM
jgi:hypothetical protein